MKKTKEFRVIECGGTAYEIGCQWGKAGKESIQRSLEMGLKVIKGMYPTRREYIMANAMKHYPLVKDFDPYLVDMIKGQADGSGLSFEEVFTLRSIFDLFMCYNQISSLCTSFAVTGQATRDGKTILGQNLDWFIDSPVDLLKIHHAGGLKQLSIFLWGVELSLSSAGFGICANGTWSAGGNYSLCIPFGCYLPKVMRQNNLNEAMEILKNTARGLEYYHMADAKGNLIGIESIQDGFNIIYPHRDVLVHSNHYLTEEFKKGDMASQIIPDSYQRVERIKKLINDHYGDITPEVMMRIMADHENIPTSICRHVDEKMPPQFRSETLASFIMVPEDNSMYAVYGNPCKYEYTKYTL